MNQGFVGTSSLVGSVTQFVGSRGQFTSAIVDDAPVSLTNAQKLSLSPSTPVGTRVSVSDGFVVSGTGHPNLDGFYWSAEPNPAEHYTRIGSDGTTTVYTQDFTQWFMHCETGEEAGEFNLHSVVGSYTYPWEVPSWTDQDELNPEPATLTHPAVQTLAAPGQGALLVSGNYSRVGLKTDRTASADGKPSYGWDRSNPDSTFIAWGYRTAGRWEIYDTDVSSGGAVFYSTSDAPTPLTATDWKNASDDSPASITIALTDPQGGVAVLGGTQDGVYANDIVGDKQNYVVLGGSTGNDDSYQIRWQDANDPSFRWDIYNNNSGALYYSLSDTLTPDLASNWKNASDDSPASITVTSVSVGDINAGLFVSNDGPTNGSSFVSQPFHGRQYYMGLNGGGSNNMHWDTDYNVWTDDIGVWTTDNVAFPHQGRDNGGGAHTGATFAINHIPNEENWTNV